MAVSHGRSRFLLDGFLPNRGLLKPYGACSPAISVGEDGRAARDSCDGLTPLWAEARGFSGPDPWLAAAVVVSNIL